MKPKNHWMMNFFDTGVDEFSVFNFGYVTLADAISKANSILNAEVRERVDEIEQEEGEWLLTPYFLHNCMQYNDYHCEYELFTSEDIWDAQSTMPRFPIDCSYEECGCPCYDYCKEKMYGEDHFCCEDVYFAYKQEES